jgi:hypothetical protein
VPLDVSRSVKTIRRKPLLPWAAGCIVFCAAVLLMANPHAVRAAAARPDQPPPDKVGTIEGDSISVEGPMTVQVVNGIVKTILRSGSDIHVKSGRARIDLVEGGRIVICGPAHLTILKSGGALTVALESGTVHAYINREPALTVYTPQIQAQPIAIGGAAQDTLVGFDTPGTMCIRARSGAVRLEQQLTGQSLMVPQGGDVLLANGQLDGVHASAGRCSCELEEVKAFPPHPNQEVSVIASAKDSKTKPVESVHSAPQPAPAAPTEQPIYKVFMPPLEYDASAKIQDAPDPRMIVLVRRVRVRPTLIFEARVEGDPVVAENTAQPSAAPPSTAEKNLGAKRAPREVDDSMFGRVKSFFRRLWSRSS